MADTTQQSTRAQTYGNGPDVDLQELKKLYSQAKAFRGKLESDWYLNLSYYMGDQWIFWNRGRIDRPKLESWRVKFVDNRILPTVVARVAKKTKSRPTFVCTPATADDSDMQNAEIAEKVLSNDWKSLNLDYQHLMVQFWAEICGAGFWKIYWDSSKGDSAQFLFGPDGEPLKPEGKKSPMRADDSKAEILLELAKQQGVEIQEKEVAKGDMAVDVISPFELYPDPLAKSMDECEWVIEEKIRSREYMQKVYGMNSVTEDAEIPVGIAESRYASESAGGKDRAKGVKVFEYFCRPNKKYPQGKWCVWANDKVLKNTTIEDSPYAEFPYVMFSSNLVPGRFWPTSITTQLRGPQTDLNKLQSQIRENAIRIGNPPVAISREANVQWSGKIGEKVLFSDTVQNALPTFIQPPEIPVYVREEINRIQDSIREISGLHEISNASVPAGITAASAINLLQEADDSRLGPEIQLMEKTLAIAGNYILRLRAKWTDDKRIIHMAGEDGKWDIFSFKGEMLEKVINVDVQAGSGMPQSKAAKQAAMQELLNLALQYGVPLNQRSMRKFFQDYEMGGLDKLFQDLENDESQITRENRRLYQGEDVLPNDFDDDDLHIEGHEEEMKTSKWEQQDENVKGKFLAHWRLHKERRVSAVQNQMQTIAQEQQQMAGQEHQHEEQLEQIKQSPEEEEQPEG
jgi:hypothetical protein